MPAGGRYRYFDDEDELCRYVADLLAAEKVVGWVQGRMEFGPRALGGRSILGDARSRGNADGDEPEDQVPANRSALLPRWCCTSGRANTSRCATAKTARTCCWWRRWPTSQRPAGAATAPADWTSSRSMRSTVPAVTHVDYSARVQTVDAPRHGRFYKLLKAFEAKTGCPVLINTSFNVRGEPIVCTPQDAYRCFLATNMDVLVLEISYCSRRSSRRRGA